MAWLSQYGNKVVAYFVWSCCTESLQRVEKFRDAIFAPDETERVVRKIIFRNDLSQLVLTVLKNYVASGSSMPDGQFPAILVGLGQ